VRDLRTRARARAGEVALFSARHLAPLARVRGAHMVFITAVAFAADEAALLSVSADASARATPLPRPGRRRARACLLLALAVLLLIVGLLAALRRRGLAGRLGLGGGAHGEL